MLSQKDYKKKFAKANAARVRALEKQKEKLSDPIYLAKLREKHNVSRKRSLEKQRMKQNSEEYKALQFEKKKKALERQRDKARQKSLKPQKNKETTKKVSKIKSKGLKGRARTAQESYLESKIAALGCVVCRLKGYHTIGFDEVPYISLHHTDGRVKPHCHAKQIGLCMFHHDTPVTDYDFQKKYPDIFPIHGSIGKARWENVNWTEEELLAITYEMIGEERPWLTSPT